MGVRGAIPNPARDQRERKNGWVTLPNVPNDKPAPPLVGEHTERGREQWARWWQSPMSTMWSQWDADELERLLGMYEVTWVDPGGSQSELRQQADRFGLTPAGRRRLMWMIDGVDTISKDATGAVPEKMATVRVLAGGKDDPRRARKSG